MKRETTQIERSDCIRALLRTLDAHHPGEEAHAQRIAVYAVAVGQHMGISDEELLILKEAALLHDLGKLAIDAALLAKEGPLSIDDLSQIRTHVIFFGQTAKAEQFEACTPIVKHHHERWDGNGFPDSLRSEDIPLGSRIIAVAESFDAASHGVAWKQPLTEEQALNEIKFGSGSQFDPDVVKAFLAVQPLIQPLV